MVFNEECPWGEDDKTPLYEICSCCGVEFGNEDYSISSVHNYREIWLKNGAQWFRKKEKADNWVIDEQMKDIPQDFK